MPLTAVSDNGEVDATACADDLWSSLHRARPAPALRCRMCAASMHAKVSGRGLRFFAHHAGADCPSAGETPEHRFWKRALASVIREAGWHAAIEAEPAVGDLGGWRADVLAVEASTEVPRRTAFEVQLAGMTPAEGKERTERYRADGIETVWVTTRYPRWFYEVPGLRVEDGGSGDLGTLGVTRGLVRQIDGRWRSQDHQDLGSVVRRLLDRRLVAYDIGYFGEQIPYGDRTREYWVDRAVAWVDSEEVERLEHERRQREIEAARAREHEERLEALFARQEAVLPIAICDARDSIGASWSVFVGVPPTWFQGELSRVDAAGNESTAHGLVIWTGFNRSKIDLFAVVCPVAARISPRLARSWAKRGVRVYAADSTEATRLAHALGCSTRDIVIADVAT